MLNHSPLIACICCVGHESLCARGMSGSAGIKAIRTAAHDQNPKTRRTVDEQPTGGMLVFRPPEQLALTPNQQKIHTTCIKQETDQPSILGRLDNNNFRGNVRVTSSNLKAFHFATNSTRSNLLAVRITALRNGIKQWTIIVEISSNNKFCNKQSFIALRANGLT